MKNSKNKNIKFYYEIDDLNNNKDLKSYLISSIIKELENKTEAFGHKVKRLENKDNTEISVYLRDIELIMSIFLKWFIEENRLPDKFNINGIVDFVEIYKQKDSKQNSKKDQKDKEKKDIFKEAFRKVFPTKESYQIAYVNKEILLHCERKKPLAIRLDKKWHDIKKNKEKFKVIDRTINKKCCNNNQNYIFSPQFFTELPNLWFFNVVQPYFIIIFRKVEESYDIRFYVLTYVISTLSYIRQSKSKEDKNNNNNNNKSNNNNNKSKGREQWKKIKAGVIEEKPEKCKIRKEVLEEILNYIEENRTSLYDFEGNINIDLIAKIVVIHGISQMLGIIGADNPVLKTLKFVLGDEIGSQWKTVFNNLLKESDCVSTNDQAQSGICHFLLNIECLVKKLKEKLEKELLIYIHKYVEESAKYYENYLKQIILNSLENRIDSVNGFAEIISFEFEEEEIKLKKIKEKEGDDSTYKYEVFVDNKKVCNVEIKGKEIYFT